MLLFEIYDAVAPYRLYLFVVFLCSLVVANLIRPMAANVAPGFMLPDMMANGYTPHQVLTWYEAIGETGRDHYAYFIYPLDMFLITPLYVLSLGSHLYKKSATPRPPPPEGGGGRTMAEFVRMTCYLPPLAAALDVVESTTIAYGATIFPDGVRPSNMETLLSVASVATRIKHLALAVAFLVALSTFFFFAPTSPPPSGQKGGPSTKLE